ncbi:MAG: A/G-specific adenine glycosylase [Paludibacteraceae bacterium]|nr:A/G-specific adenine glycosylase [Paludibacteraceae bacterium]
MKNSELLYYQLYTWFDHNQRVLPWRETEDAYQIWVSEIILQQTRVEQGLPYFMRFVERFPTLLSLAEANEDEVLRYWQGLGYYSRARNMYKAAQQLVSKGQTTFPQTFEDIRALPGIGDYTAGAISAFAYNQPYPALDGNVYRVLARLTDCEIPFDTSAGKRHFHQVANEILDRNNPRLFDSALMEFGALYCVPASPDCAACPLQTWCQAYAHHTVDLLPVRKPRPKIRDRYFNYTIYITPDKQTLIRQRQDKDIWHHLWEFPLAETDRLLPAKGLSSIDLKHQLSHQRLHARFTLQPVTTLPDIPQTKVVHISDIDDFALSRLTLKAMEYFGL